MTLALGERVLCLGFHGENNGFLPAKTDKQFGVMKSLFESVYLLRRQRAEIILGESADKKSTNYATITALYSAVKRQSQEQALIVAY